MKTLSEDQVAPVLDSLTGETLTQFAAARLATAQRFGGLIDARIRDYQWGSNDAFITAGNGMGEASHLSFDPMRPESHPVSSPILGVAMLGVGPMGVPADGAGARPDSWIRTWIDGSGIYGDVDGNSNESAFDYTIWGGSLGTDLLLAEHWVLGLAGGYANTDLDFSSRPGDGEIDTYQGALYAGYVDPRFHVGVSGRYAYNDMDGKREIRFGDINRKANADLDGDDYGARFEGGLNLLELGGIVLQPIASVDYNHLTQDDVTESGAGSLNLTLEDYDLDSLVTGFGMRVRGRWKVGQDIWMVPELHGRWLHEFLDTDRLIEARLVSDLGASAFQIQGVELPRDSGSIGFAWSVITNSAWSVTGSYDAILNEDLVQHVGSIALNFEW
jgi:outer membrane autotransporter protein